MSNIPTIFTFLIGAGQVLKLGGTIVFGVGLFRTSKELKESVPGPSSFRYELLFFGIYLGAGLIRYIVEPHAAAYFINAHIGSWEPSVLRRISLLISLPGRLLTLTAFAILVRGCYKAR